jgi:hypothetical protein
MKNRPNHLYALAGLSSFFLVPANAKPEVQDTQGNATEECAEPVKEQKADSKNGFQNATDPEKKGEESEKSDGKPKESKKEEEDKAKTHEAKREPLYVKLNLEGVFESARMSEVSVNTKSWGELTVLEAKLQGAVVKKANSS